MQMDKRFYLIPRDKKFSVHFLINDSGQGQPASGSLWTAIR